MLLFLEIGSKLWSKDDAHKFCRLSVFRFQYHKLEVMFDNKLEYLQIDVVVLSIWSKANSEFSFCLLICRL